MLHNADDDRTWNANRVTRERVDSRQSSATGKMIVGFPNVRPIPWSCRRLPGKNVNALPDSNQ